MLDDARSRVVVFIDAVSEAHQFRFAGLYTFDESGHVGERANLHQHAKHFFVGAAVERAVQRGGGRGGRGERVHMGTANASHRIGRAILLVVGMQDKKHVERALQRRIRTVFELGRLKQHVQKIPRVTQFVVWIREWHAQTVPVGKCRQRRHFADQPVGLLASRFLIEDVLRLGIKRRKRGDGGNHHTHRVSVVVEPIQEFLDGLVDKRMVRDVVGPLIELRAIGQFTVQNQIGGLEVSAFLGQLLDGISAVPQDAFVTVNECDLTMAQRCITEGRVIAHHAEVIRFYFNLPQVHRADCLVSNRKFVGLPRPVVGEGDRVPGRGGSLVGRSSLRFRFDWVHYYFSASTHSGPIGIYTNFRFSGSGIRWQPLRPARRTIPILKRGVCAGGCDENGPIASKILYEA